MNEAQYFEQFAGDESIGFDRAVMNLLDWSYYPDAILCESILIVRTEWQKLNAEPELRKNVLKNLSDMKWNETFICGRPHDMSNPGVQADFALLDLSDKFGSCRVLQCLT